MLLQAKSSKQSIPTTCVRKLSIIGLYFESENELKFYNLEARSFAARNNCTCKIDKLSDAEMVRMGISSPWVKF